MQQGRPLLDADWNEQTSLAMDREWRLVRSLLNKNHGTFDHGFYPEKISVVPPDVEGKQEAVRVLEFCHGTYWLEGLCCELPQSSERHKLSLSSQAGIVYLEAWEDTIPPSAAPNMLEPTLNHNDTAWRAKVAWRLAALPAVAGAKADPCKCDHQWSHLKLSPPDERRMYVRRKQDSSPKSTACENPESASAWPGGDYLYRVEVHQIESNGKMQIKWSRENGSAVYAIRNPSTENLSIEHDRFSTHGTCRKGDYLELRDSFGRSANKYRELVKVVHANEDAIRLEKSFELNYPEAVSSYSIEFPTVSDGEDARKNALDKLSYFVQRWNHSGTVDVSSKIKNGSDVKKEKSSKSWIDIEDGIQVGFESGKCYAEGDYWLIRTSPAGKGGFVGLADDEMNGKCSLPRTGGHHHVVLAQWNMENNKELIHCCWHQISLQPGKCQKTAPSQRLPSAEDGSQSSAVSSGPPPAPAAPAEEKTPGAAAPAAPPAAPSPDSAAAAGNCASLLTADGRAALKFYVSTLKDVSRHIPASYLNFEPRSLEYRRFRAPLLLSDLSGPLEQYLAKVERCLDLTDEQRELALADARTDHELAAEFQRYASYGPARSPIA